MKADYIDTVFFYAILEELTYPNQLAMLTALKTGLRIDDVLALKKDRLHLSVFVVEKKTKKHKRAYLGKELYNDLKAFANSPKYSRRDSVFLFPHRTKPHKHRTRQAVYNDIKKAVKKLRLSGNFSPHSARKLSAVNKYKKTNDLQKVKKFLNHDSELVTILYALSDNPDILRAIYKK